MSMTAVQMYSIPIAMTINPIILDTALIPEAPSHFTIYGALFSIRKTIKQTKVTAVSAVTFQCFFEIPLVRQLIVK